MTTVADVTMETKEVASVPTAVTVTTKTEEPMEATQIDYVPAEARPAKQTILRRTDGPDNTIAAFTAQQTATGGLPLPVSQRARGPPGRGHGPVVSELMEETLSLPSHLIFEYLIQFLTALQIERRAVFSDAPLVFKDSLARMRDETVAYYNASQSRRGGPPPRRPSQPRPYEQRQAYPDNRSVQQPINRTEPPIGPVGGYSRPNDQYFQQGEQGRGNGKGRRQRDRGARQYPAAMETRSPQ